MRILLTGATGLLGSHLARVLVTRGDTVTAIVRPTSRTESLRQLGVQCLPIPLDQIDSLTAAMRNTDAVVHAAARVHTTGLWSDYYHVTVTGTCNVLAAAAASKIRHFIHISSVGVYGWPRPDGWPFVETDEYGQLHRWNYYSRAKLLAEQLVHQSSVPFTILRPTLVYGPGDAVTLGRIVAALQSRRLKFIGDGTNRLSLIFVTDVANAIAATVHQPKVTGEIFNVAADELCLTQQEFIHQLCHLTGAAVPNSRISYATADRLAFFSECIAHATAFQVCPPLTRLAVLLLGGRRGYNSDKLRHTLNWQPTVAMTDGLRAYESSRNSETNH